jgi:threonine synthase
MSHASRVVVRVPATSANLGPGFDCLGLALALYSTFDVSVVPDADPHAEQATFDIVSSWGEDASIEALPSCSQNLFYQAFAARMREHDLPAPTVHVRATVGAPLGRGLGSSATAVVGGILAADALAGRLNDPPNRAALLDAAVALEHGQHADNVAAALLGGLTATARDQRSGSWRAVSVPVPEALRAVLFVPVFSMDTVAGRQLLPAHYSKADAVHNVGHVALLLGALATGDLSALSAAIDDRLHEPYRAQVFPQLPDLLDAARAAGAHGACLSGGGSSILALATGGSGATYRAQAVAEALAQTALALQLEGRTLILEIDRGGATVEWPDAAVSYGNGKIADAVVARSKANELSLACPACDERYDLTRTDYRCACGNPLDVALGDLGANLPGSVWRERFDARLRSQERVDRSGVWRFRDLLLPLDEIAPVTRPEGETNLYPVGTVQAQGGHAHIGAFAGVERMWIKHEGENPTGSFKDRGMTFGVSVAKWLGATAVACASTGNTSASMAAYAAQAGLRAIVILPEGKVAAGKLGQAIAYGAQIRQIAGDFDRAMQDVERMCLDDGIYLLNSLNPFRILGQQSLAFEIAQQLGWDVPDWIALPAGNLGNTSALGMGLMRAYDLGIIGKLPRIAAIQAAGANPFYQSYQTGFAEFAPVKAQTIATAINIGNPVSFRRARAVIEATNGVVAQVTDDEILRAKAVIDRAGIGCEPASAASVAGVRQLTAAGVIRPDERVVAVLTGNLLKDPDAIMLAQRAAEAEPEAGRSGASLVPLAGVV